MSAVTGEAKAITPEDAYYVSRGRELCGLRAGVRNGGGPGSARRPRVGRSLGGERR